MRLPKKKLKKSTKNNVGNKIKKAGIGYNLHTTFNVVNLKNIYQKMLTLMKI